MFLRSRLMLTSHLLHLSGRRIRLIHYIGFAIYRINKYIISCVVVVERRSSVSISSQLKIIKIGNKISKEIRLFRTELPKYDRNFSAVNSLISLTFLQLQKFKFFLPCLIIKVGALFSYTVKLKVIPQ
jgi:hypothetical protein